MYLIIHEDGESWLESIFSDTNQLLADEGYMQVFKVEGSPQKYSDGEFIEVEVEE